MKTKQPLIGIAASTMNVNSLLWHVVGEPNIRAVIEIAECQPLLIPALGPKISFRTILKSLDGLLLTGGAANIEPHHYSELPARAKDLHDPMRDATTLPLILETIDMGLPLFAICRGFQELNVAFGGTLHPYLHELPDRFDHRRDRTKPIEDQLKPVHTVEISGSGILGEIAGSQSAKVNSLHGQGVRDPGPGLKVEAVAQDSTIEALSVSNANAWALGVQWHPEFCVDNDLFSKALFESYGSACRNHAANR